MHVPCFMLRVTVAITSAWPCSVVTPLALCRDAFNWLQHGLRCSLEPNVIDPLMARARQVRPSLHAHAAARLACAVVRMRPPNFQLALEIVAALPAPARVSSNPRAFVAMLHAIAAPAGMAALMSGNVTLRSGREPATIVHAPADAPPLAYVHHKTVARGLPRALGDEAAARAAQHMLGRRAEEALGELVRCVAGSRGGAADASARRHPLARLPPRRLAELLTAVAAQPAPARVRQAAAFALRGPLTAMLSHQTPFRMRAWGAEIVEMMRAFVALDLDLHTDWVAECGYAAIKSAAWLSGNAWDAPEAQLATPHMTRDEDALLLASIGALRLDMSDVVHSRYVNTVVRRLLASHPGDKCVLRVSLIYAR